MRTQTGLDAHVEQVKELRTENADLNDKWVLQELLIVFRISKEIYCLFSESHDRICITIRVLRAKCTCEKQNVMCTMYTCRLYNNTQDSAVRSTVGRSSIASTTLRG